MEVLPKNVQNPVIAVQDLQSGALHITLSWSGGS